MILASVAMPFRRYVDGMRSSVSSPLTAASFSTGSRLLVSRLNGLRKKANSREEHRKAKRESGGCDVAEAEGSESEEEHC